MRLPFVQKYRPVVFDDFIIDKKLIDILKLCIQSETLNILLVGDIGSGKSSLIDAIINEYYNHLHPACYNDNVLYISSLKEQGIAYYRNEVRTFCQTTTSIHGKKRIIILDDLDLINEQSQQVFRNCIDKFEHNVHFIASCTNPQKVIESLQSRLNIFKIKSLNENDIHKIMKKIMEEEKILISEDAQTFVLSICNNSIRKVINYLEKFKLLGKPINLDIAVQLCTDISFNEMIKYTNYCLNGELCEAIKVINSIFDNGFSVMDILDNYFLFVKITDLMSEEQKYKTIPLLCKYIIMFNNLHEDPIELTFFTNNFIKVLQEK
jgi:DNA polymerase III delta prime subunit